jgi:hypothetical protein
MACWYSPIWGSLKPGKGPGFKSSGVHVKYLPMSLTLGVANGLPGCVCCCDSKKIK